MIASLLLPHPQAPQKVISPRVCKYRQCSQESWRNCWVAASTRAPSASSMPNSCLVVAVTPRLRTASTKLSAACHLLRTLFQSDFAEGGTGTAGAVGGVAGVAVETGAW